MFNNRIVSFNRRWLNVCVALIVLSIIISALGVLLHLRQVTETKAIIMTQNLATTLELSIEAIIDKAALSTQSIADEISQETTLNTLNIALINQHITEQKSRLPEINYLRATNVHGDVVYGIETELPPLSNADRNYFITLRDAKNPHLIVVTSTINRMTHQWVLLIACRINKPDGSFDGIVYAAILLDTINTLLARVQLGEYDSIALRDSDLKLLARYPEPHTIGIPISSQKISVPFTVALQANRHAGSYISDLTSIDGISRWHSYRQNSKYGFFINVGISYQTVLAEWYKQLWLITSLVSVFIIAILVFSKLIKHAWLRQEHDMVLLRDNQQALYDAQKLVKIGNYRYDIQADSWISSEGLDDIFGISKEYLRTAEEWLSLIVVESRQSMHSYLQFIITHHLPFDCEYRIVRFNDQQERWVHGKGTLQFDAHGQPAYLVGTIQDITKRKLAELEISLLNIELETRVRQRTAELETVNQSLIAAKEAADAGNLAKSTFIATMSHELRTPLNAILGFSELLSQDATVTKTQKDTLAIIMRSGAHLLSMINDVLELSKIEAGRLELNNQTFELPKLLQDIGNMIAVRATHKKLSFRLEIAPDIARYIETDSGKLRQVLINLLGNAVKFTDNGGVILRAHTLSTAMTRNIMLFIEIADSGTGIPQEQQSQLFKPFTQLVRKNLEIEGTGLGLVISKSLLELMGGMISVQSIVGVGTTFKIELPVSIASNAPILEERQSVKSLAPNQPTWRLLVVDDNADNRLLLSTILKQLGFEVREANNGQEAVTLFTQWQPALCWMDMKMPVMDGYEATRQIRQLAGGDRVKIVALTASAFAEQHASIIAAGCDAVLHKPFHAADIFATLSSQLGVNFIYQDTALPNVSSLLALTERTLSTLPLTLRQELHQAALNLDIDEAEIIIAKLQPYAPDIAKALQVLVQSYQFEQIIQLTEINDTSQFIS